MSKKRIIIIISSVLLLFIIFYNRYFFVSLFSVVSSKFSTPDLKYVEANQWQYESGFKIGEGDFVEFSRDNSIFQLKHDTIYFRDKPRAIVTQTNKKFYQMTVTSLDGHATGEYLNTDELSQ